VALPALVGRNPDPDLPWWVVTDVLCVPALELCDPVPLLVLMVPHDLTVHGPDAPVRDSTQRLAGGLNEGSFRISSDQSHALGNTLVAAPKALVDPMALSRFSIRSPNHSSPVHWVLASITVIPLDYFTGPYLDSMVLLYPLPAAMAAWSGSRRWSIALAAALPPVRMLIFHYWGWQAPALEAALDTTVIVLFSIVLALMILHLRRQAQTLRVLEGMLPICAFCKRIRNGESWEPLEGFISNHSEAEFSHTFCDDCGSKHYPDYLAP
jgi:hypothetical protein